MRGSSSAESCRLASAATWRTSSSETVAGLWCLRPWHSRSGHVVGRQGRFARTSRRPRRYEEYIGQQDAADLARSPRNCGVISAAAAATPRRLLPPPWQPCLPAESPPTARQSHAPPPPPPPPPPATPPPAGPAAAGRPATCAGRSQQIAQRMHRCIGVLSGLPSLDRDRRLHRVPRSVMACSTVAISLHPGNRSGQVGPQPRQKNRRVELCRVGLPYLRVEAPFFLFKAQNRPQAARCRSAA